MEVHHHLFLTQLAASHSLPDTSYSAAPSGGEGLHIVRILKPAAAAVILLYMND